MKPHVLVQWPLRTRQMEMVAADYLLCRMDEAADPAALIAEAGPRIRAIIAGGERPVGRALLDRLPALEIVATMSVGTDAIDLQACRDRGIAVTNTPDVLTDDVADAALMLMLAARRGLIAGHDKVRSGGWKAGAMPLTSSLTGKRAGIAGLGRIGKAIAARCEVLGMEVGYTARNQRSEVLWPYFNGLIELAAWCDVLILSMPGGDATKGVVNAAVLTALGPQGTLVNVARGSVVDEPALISALRDGRIANAALDVFWNEPTPDPALVSLPNVVLYPHHASGTVETRDRMAQLVVDNLAAHFAGRPLLTSVL